MANIIREKCTICESELTPLFDYKMPVYMGASDEIYKHYNNMNFCYCKNCGCVQLNELLPLEIVYQNNHNVDLVGDIWNRHFCKLSEFIGDVSNMNILEISDCSAKLASKCKNYKLWNIVEPNPKIPETHNIKFIQKFFDETFEMENIDIILHSHVFEHMYDINSFLQSCNKLLKYNQKMIFSIPDLHHLIENSDTIINNILHFEHTFFYDEKIIEYGLYKNGFKINKTFNFENHSLFIECIKTDKKIIKLQNKNYHNKFISKFNYSIDKIKSLNIINTPVYLFGCHVNSQYLINNGLNLQIKNILDSSIIKQDKYLFGTDILTKSPNIINDGDIIICSHMSIYYDEIKKTLLNINPNVVIL